MANKQLRQRKSSPRLRGFDYAGPYAYFVTCATEHRKPYFKHKAIVDSLLLTLEEASSRFGFSVYAYCFMPDHLHLLLVGNEDSSLRSFMTLFKQRGNFAFKEAYGDSLWQKSYYDHVLRKEEALNDVALYILNNPVRKGLATDCHGYPFSGSLVIDVAESPNVGTGLQTCPSGGLT